MQLRDPFAMVVVPAQVKRRKATVAVGSAPIEGRVKVTGRRRKNRRKIEVKVRRHN